MTRITRRFAVVAAFGMSLVLWSCDNLADSTRPELRPAPMVVKSTSGTTYVVAYETSPTAGSVSAVIGAAGGELALGEHRMWVTAGAVADPATFTIARDPEYPLRVHFTATRETENDVGNAGFAAPVYVSLSYDAAAELPEDESSLEVIYFRPDGLVEVMPTTVHTIENQAVAQVPHFSMYGIAWP